MVLKARVKAFRQKEVFNALGSAGQGMAEYIIVAVLIAVIIIIAIRYFGGSIQGQFENATEQVRSPGDSIPGGDSAGAGHSVGRSVGISDEGGGGESLEPSGPKSGSAKEAAGGDELGGGDDLSKEVASLRSEPVGDVEDSPIEEIVLDWKLLALIAGIIFAVGMYIVFQSTSEDKKSKKAKKKKKKKKTPFSRDGSQGKGEKGQAMVEFLFSAITFLFVILGTIQLAMVLNAYILVRYAAYNAARAAIVHADDASNMEDQMREAARISLLAIFPRHGRADHLNGLMDNYLGAVLTDWNPLLTHELEQITQVSVVDGGNNVVTFDDPAMADEGVITVQVVHYYELVIPLVGRMIYWVYNRIRNGPGYQGESMEYIAAQAHIERSAGGEFRDIEYRIPIVAHYTMRLQSDYAP